jgi:hypothetical protein
MTQNQLAQNCCVDWPEGDTEISTPLWSEATWNFQFIEAWTDDSQLAQNYYVDWPEVETELVSQVTWNFQSMRSVDRCKRKMV